MTQSTTRQYPTEGQNAYLTSLVNQRFAADDDEGREPFRKQWREVVTNADVDRLIEAIKAVPTLLEREEQAKQAAREAAKAEVPTEEGFYRNPETGELYRLRYAKWDLIVSKYSETGGRRRLLADGSKIVKGTWKRYNAFQSRLALSYLRTGGPEVRRSWKITDTELATEYLYGFCPLHNGPLTDGVSVALGYGPKCAQKHGLPWSEEAARALLGERNIDADKFFAEYSGPVAG